MPLCTSPWKTFCGCPWAWLWTKLVECLVSHPCCFDILIQLNKTWKNSLISRKDFFHCNHSHSMFAAEKPRNTQWKWREFHLGSIIGTQIYEFFIKIFVIINLVQVSKKWISHSMRSISSNYIFLLPKLQKTRVARLPWVKKATSTVKSKKTINTKRHL